LENTRFKNPVRTMRRDKAVTKSPDRQTQPLAGRKIGQREERSQVEKVRWARESKQSGNPNWMIADVQFIVRSSALPPIGQVPMKHLLGSLMAAA
jgi:hypothetical protein